MQQLADKKIQVSFYFITLLFFAWGFITCLNDILAPHLKTYFSLNYTETMLLQFCFFATYAIMSLPMSALLSKLGYKKTMVFGLVLAALGCLLFWPAANFANYPLFLFGMFVLASGIVALQVAANPYVTLLGSVERASSRLTLAQAVNSLGYTIAPFLLGGLIISGSVTQAYILLAIALIVLGCIVYYYPLPAFTENTVTVTHHSGLSIWQRPIVIMGALAIFMYVGAEVSAGTLLVNYLNLPEIIDMPKEVATKYLSIYWGGALVGRFIGSWILIRVRPAKVVAFSACANIILMLISLLCHGYIAMWAMLSLGLFNSVMFPTIFALTVAVIPELQKQISGLLCVAIVGGAIIPELQGILADLIGLQNSYGLLIVSYLFILVYVISLMYRKPIK